MTATKVRNGILERLARIAVENQLNITASYDGEYLDAILNYSDATADELGAFNDPCRYQVQAILSIPECFGIDLEDGCIVYQFSLRD